MSFKTAETSPVVISCDNELFLLYFILYNLKKDLMNNKDGFKFI